MNTDITSILLSNGITDTSVLSDALRSVRATETQDRTSDTSQSDADFKSMLAEESARLASGTATSTDMTAHGQMRELITALDKSVLGQVAGQLDTDELAEDLLTHIEGADRVIDQLVSGHMSSIAMMDIDDFEDSTDAFDAEVSESLTEPSTETLAQNLETLMEHLNQIGT